MNDIDYLRALRSALNNLYEPDQLRLNPLIDVLGLAGRIDSPSALQEILVDSIAAIKESGDDGNFARAWLAHDVLHFRYVRGYSRESVAGKLNMSDRQLSRELRSAIDMLAAMIWARHLPTNAPAAEGSATFRKQIPEQAGRESTQEGQWSSPFPPGESEQETLGENATWLQGLPEENSTGWRGVLDSVLFLLQPLMEQHQTHLKVRIERPLSDLQVAQNALRQSLLLLLGWLIPAASRTTIVLAPDVVNGVLQLRWETNLTNGAIAAGAATFEILRQLLVFRGGALEVPESDEEAPNALEEASATNTILLAIPALAQVPILAIDDNRDTIQLFQRYVQGTRYVLTGVSNPDEVLRTIERVQPRVILLDVMMPEIDGWDILARLRMLPNADTRSIIVCSIMPLERVAVALGAHDFLQKPVMPQRLLEVLDAQMGKSNQ